MMSDGSMRYGPADYVYHNKYDAYDSDYREARARDVEIAEHDRWDRQERERELARELARELEREATSRREKEAELQRLYGQIFDLTQPRASRSPGDRQRHVTERLAGGGRMAGAVEIAKKALATAVERREDLQRNVVDAIAWRYWAGIPAADRLLIRNRRALDTTEATRLKARHVDGCAEHVRSVLASVGSDASTADLEAALERDALAPFRIAPRPGHECPECKGKLVGRNRTSDGLAFVGCSGFPP